VVYAPLVAGVAAAEDRSSRTGRLAMSATERFSKQEMWGLYWVAWWMSQQEDKRQLGGTLTVALQTIREMIGTIPKGYDPLDDGPAAAVPSAEVIAAFDDMRYVVGMVMEVCGWEDGNVPDPIRGAVEKRMSDEKYSLIRAYLAAQETT
jgi:hypothetical protein